MNIISEKLLIISFYKMLMITILLVSGGTSQAQQQLYSAVFPLGDVVLLDGPFRHALDLNIETLLKYDVERLLAPYRKEAGLPMQAEGYSNWDGLAGHVGGHYLSALSMHYAATGNAECFKRMTQIISVLKQCQDSNATRYPEWGVGYVGGVPNSKQVWSTLKKGDFKAYHDSWVAWYNVHKMYAGLRDAWLYAGNMQAKEIFLKFCSWGINVTSTLSDDQMQKMLDTEHGGMNEVFADAYQMTGESKYLVAAKRFSHRALLDPMSSHIDDLDNKHANTQVPKAIGFQRIGEVSHDKPYRDAGRYFWETVTTTRSLAFGGNSRREFFPSAKAYVDFIQDVEGPETCNSYNMLKLTADLFRMESSGRYVDYYERTLYNHILSSQHPGHGGYVYFTPARPRHYRVYSTPNQAMWCCVGSGMENHAKSNELIFTHRSDSLFVNLFIASDLQWKERNIRLRQETRFPSEEKTVIRFTEGASRFTLLIRTPSWVGKDELIITINGSAQRYKANSQSYVTIDREWKKGDVVEIALPMQSRVEALPHVSSFVAFMHGPILLASRTGSEDLAGLLADDGRWGQIASGKKLPITGSPILIDSHPESIATKLVPVKGKDLTFQLSGTKIVNATDPELVPFYTIHDSRYVMYWMALTPLQHQSYSDSLRQTEVKRLAILNQTIDAVAPGEQQPEADHDLQQINSRSGIKDGVFYRDAPEGGWFDYRLATNGETSLRMMVRYWGAEWGSRVFDIDVDGQKLITENNTQRWTQSIFFDVEYVIPDAMVKNKKTIRIRFKPGSQSTAGGVYDLRLLRTRK